MNIKELHYSFKIKADKIDSLKTRNLLPAEIDWILNESIQQFVDNKYGDFETIQDLTDQLSTLVIKSPTPLQPGISVTQIESGVYELKLDDLEYPYLHLVRLRAKCSKEQCIDKVINGREVSHDDINKVLLSPFEGPSFIWLNLPFLFGKSSTTGSSIYLYTNNMFQIEEVYPDYIKIPTKVFFGGYNSLDGLYTSSDPEVTSDLPEAFHRRIVDIAVAETYRNFNSEVFQLKYQKTLNQ